jgi:hypothetical protein
LNIYHKEKDRQTVTDRR